MIGGIQGGYNWQGGNWVGGIEADIQISGQGATPSYLCPGAVCNPGIADFAAPVTATFDQGHKLDSFGTLRGRFGTTITPDVMVYATGGLAVGSIRSTVRLAGVGFDADGNPGAVSNAVSVLTQKAGWTAGAGLEGRLFGNVTGKIEYLYMDFGTISTSVTNPFNATPVTLSSNSRITDNIVRVGLNYKLDPARGVYDVLAGIGAPSVYKALPYKGPVAYGTPIRPRGPGPASMSAAPSATAGANPTRTRSSAIPPRQANCSPPTARASSRERSGAPRAVTTGSPAICWPAWKRTSIIPASAQECEPAARARSAIPLSSASSSDPSVLALSDQGQKLEWFATLRGRLGATVTPGALAYVTGGLAVGEIMTAGTVFGFDGDGNPVNTIVSSHNTKAGWTVGGGIEGRLAGNWTARLEYLYLDLGTVSTVPTPAANATVATAFNSRVTDNIVRAGLNYKFDTLAGIWAND